jgi:hypothetical protein
MMEVTADHWLTMMNISEHTIHNVAADAGYHQCVTRKVLFLTVLQKRKRVTQANEFKDFDAQKWGDLIWSDKCYIHLDDKSGQVYVTHCAHEEYDENCVIPIFKQSLVCVMFWGCIMKGRKGPLIVLEYQGGQGGGMTGQKYILQVLEAHLEPFYH